MSANIRVPKTAAKQFDGALLGDSSLLDRFKGAMVLSAVGDALGWPTEFLKESAVCKIPFSIPVREFVFWRKIVGGRWWGYLTDIRPGEYSDDTQMNLAVARSISLCGNFDPQHFAYAELPLWLEYERGGGRAVKAAARSVTGRNKTWNTNFYKAGDTEYCQAGGNGAAMRIVPIALVNTYDMNRLVYDCVINSIITHGHPRGILGSVIVATTIVHALTDEKFDAAHTISHVSTGINSVGEIFKRDGLLREWVDRWNSAKETQGLQFFDVLSEVQKETVAHLHAIPNHLDREPREYYRLVGALDPQTKGSGTGTACAALYMSLQGQGNPAEALIVAANQIGSDTDTIASCLGAVLGARIGYENIPPIWRNHVKHGKYISDMAERICKIATGETVVGEISGLLDQEEATVERKRWSEQLRELLTSPQIGRSADHPTLGVGVVKEVLERETAKQGSSMRLVRVRFGGDRGQTCVFGGRFSVTHLVGHVKIPSG